MCGIVGAISKKTGIIEAERMRDALKRRGPDGAGIFFDEKNSVFLGHRRLSLIDLSQKADQPMERKGKNGNGAVIVFNGEVYNFRKLRKELEQKGYEFKTQSDTEVVLFSYLEWGTDCFKKFQGMFALAIWDEKEKNLILARDRFGVKPLYVFCGGSEIFFASEIKAFFTLSQFSKKINRQAVYWYFRQGFIPEPFSVFENIERLEPGSFWKIKLSGEKEKGFYWRKQEALIPLGERNFFSSEKIVEELEKILTESFRARLEADVEVGLFLSGGIDSSLTAAILKRFNPNLKTFTLGFWDKESDESVWGKRVSESLKTDHHEKIISEKDFSEGIFDFAEIFDEPFGDSSAIPSILLAKFARNFVKAAVSGDGGDELFFGYSKYEFLKKWFKHPFYFNFLAKSAGFLGPEKAGALYSLWQKNKNTGFSNLPVKIFKAIEMSKAENFSQAFALAGSHWPEREISKLLNFSNFKDQDLFYEDENLDFREQMQLWDFQNYLAADILVKADRSAMGFGLEAREPYLDDSVWNFLGKLDPKLKFELGARKFWLKEILKKYLKESLVERPKVGFRPPVEKWLKTKDGREILQDLFFSDKIKNQDIIDWDFARKKVSMFLDGREFGSDKIWTLLAFRIWQEKWLC